MEEIPATKPEAGHKSSLFTFERYGFVEMLAAKRSKKPVAKSVDFDISIPAK